MKVGVVNGYGVEKETAEQQSTFLNWFKQLLSEVDLPIESIVSERPTGGPITLEVPDYVEFNEITRAFLTLATVLSQQTTREEGEETHVSFDLVLPGCSEPITVLGTGY